jgi:hypothetical protein
MSVEIAKQYAQEINRLARNISDLVEERKASANLGARKISTLRSSRRFRKQRQQPWRSNNAS